MENVLKLSQFETLTDEEMTAVEGGVIGIDDAIFAFGFFVLGIGWAHIEKYVLGW